MRIRATAGALAFAWALCASCTSARDELRPSAQVQVTQLQPLELVADRGAVATFTAPDGRTIERHAFASSTGAEIRFLPTQPGRWSFVLREGQRVINQGELDVVAGPAHGLIRRDPRDAHELAFDDGTPFVPLGENRINIFDPSWNYANRDIDEYVAAMAREGMNTLRVFIFSDCRVNGVVAPGRRGCLEPRVGNFDPAVAAQFDEVFRSAERHGVYVILTAFAIGFTPGDAWKGWEGNPYNALNGGPAATTGDFFTSPVARDAEANRLRYLADRYGASPNLLAIDLLNEPEWDGAIPESMWIDWAKDMAARWKHMDPYGHLVTAGSVGLHWNIGGDERPWYGSPQDDLVEWHLYGRETYEVHALAETMTRKVQETWQFEKPIVCGEFAYGGEAKPAYDHTHVGIWALLLSGAGAIAHSAPPFTLDSDEPMTPERAEHFTVLANFMREVEHGAPLMPVHAPSDAADAPSSWWLLGHGVSALWVLAPEAGYGRELSSEVAIAQLAPGAYQVRWIDDVSGRELRVEHLRLGPGARLRTPRYTRHVAALLISE